MQEALKYSDSPRLYDALKISDQEWQEPDVQATDIREPSETPDTTDRAEAPEPDDTAEAVDAADAPRSDAAETVSETATAETLDLSEPSDAPSSLVTLDAQETPYERRTTYSAPAPTGLLNTPLLASAAALATLVAGWSYTSLESTRAELKAMTDAKTAAERALVEAQSRLTNAEKAVAAVKAALTSVPAVAVPAAAAKATETTKDSASK